MIYTKMEGDRQVFSDCHVIMIQDENGLDMWISNPTPEMIANAGWVEYVPPEETPTIDSEPDQWQITLAVKKMLSDSIKELSDEEALSVAALYDTWSSKIGENVNAGERLWYNNKLYKVKQSHTVQETWNPIDATSLYYEISIEEWPEWVQPLEAQEAYNKGDKVSHNGRHWISNIDGNVWEPGSVGAESLWTAQD